MEGRGEDSCNSVLSLESVLKGVLHFISYWVGGKEKGKKRASSSSYLPRERIVSCPLDEEGSVIFSSIFAL